MSKFLLFLFWDYRWTLNNKPVDSDNSKRGKWTLTYNLHPSILDSYSEIIEKHIQTVENGHGRSFQMKSVRLRLFTMKKVTECSNTTTQNFWFIACKMSPSDQITSSLKKFYISKQPLIVVYINCFYSLCELRKHLAVCMNSRINRTDLWYEKNPSIMILYGDV